MAGINDTLGQWAENFIDVFRQGGETFVGLVVGIVPLLIVLLTAVHALIKLIGPERIDRVGEMAGRPGLQYYPIRYIVLPVLAVFFLTNPMAYTMAGSSPSATSRPSTTRRSASSTHRSGCSPMSTPVSCSSMPASRPGSRSSACRSATWPSATSTSA